MLPVACNGPRLRFVAVAAHIVELRQLEAGAPPHHQPDADNHAQAPDVEYQAEDQVERAVPEGDPEQGLGNVVIDRDD